MPLDDIVAVTITTETAQVARTGFGIPLVAAKHTNWTERTRSYSASTALSTLVTEGFATDDPAYLAVRAILSQNPRPRTVKVGRRADADWTQITRIIPDAPSALEVYSVDVDGDTASFTADDTPTLAEVCTGIAAAINAIVGVTVTADGSSGTHVVVTSDDALKLHSVTYTDGAEHNFQIQDFTAAVDIDTELAAIRAADSDWYGLVIDSCATAEIADAAAWSEAQTVLFAPNSADTDILGSSTTDLFSDLETAAYARTVPLYGHKQDAFGGAAWLGAMLPFDPGAATFAYKTLAGVPVSVLSPTEIANIEAKHGNYYVSLAGVPITKEGWSSSGEYADITIFVDWLKARIQERIFSLLVNRPKLPYTDESVDLVRAEILAQLQDGIEAGGLAADPAPTVTAPLVADVSPADRAARLLPDVEFSGRLAGAIHELDIQGNLSI